MSRSIMLASFASGFVSGSESRESIVIESDPCRGIVSRPNILPSSLFSALNGSEVATRRDDAGRMMFGGQTRQCFCGNAFW